MPNDAALLLRYAEHRDEAAFAEFVRRHLDGVYSAASRRLGGDRHLAEDVAQEVFSTLARRAGQVGRHSAPSAWLHAATRNAAISVVRREHRRKIREQEAQTMHELSSPNTPPADWSRIAPVLDEVIDHLSENDRRAVLLRFVDRQGFAGIGAALKLSEDAARMKVDRALEKMRRLLIRRGIRSTSSALALALTSHAVASAPAGMAAIITGTALATGGCSVASALGVFQFMGSTKFAASAAALALCFTAGVPIFQAHRSAEGELASVVAETDRLTAISAALNQRIEAAQQAQLALQNRTNGDRSDNFATSQQPASNRAASGSRRAHGVAIVSDEEMLARGIAFVKGNVEARRLIQENNRARIHDRFRPLFQALGLTPAQMEAFHEAIAQAGSLRFGNAAGLSITIPSAQGALPHREETEKRVRAVLGEEGFKRYREFERSHGARELTEQIGSAVYTSPSPLSRAQAEKLTALFTQHSTSFTQGGSFNSSAIDWDAVLADSRTILTDTQWAALTAARERTRYAQALSAATREAYNRWTADNAVHVSRK